MGAALEELRAGGCREVVLWTEERNQRPRRLYRQAGRRLDGGEEGPVELQVRLDDTLFLW